MKHVRVITTAPAPANEEFSIGQIISVVAQLLQVIGAALVTKDPTTPTGA